MKRRLLLAAGLLLLGTSFAGPERKTVLLLGDSIRMGYGPQVRELMKDRADVVYPEENGMFAYYTLRMIWKWTKLVPDPNAVDVIHFNNGLWDLGQRDGRDCLTPVDVYAATLSRIVDELRHFFPNARIVFATTTPVNESVVCEQHTKGNAEVERYNAAARSALAGCVDAVDDLYGFVREHGVGRHYRDIVHYTPEGCRLLAEQVVRSIDAVGRELDAPVVALRLPGVPVESEDLTAVPGAAFPLPNHPKVTAYDLMDQTDNHNELLTTREWTAQWNERTFSVATCVLDVQDAETGAGRVFVRLAPLPHARPVKTDDFRVDSHARTVEVLSNGYPFVTREYAGGRVGRIRALNAIQREIRPYRTGRDGRILSNNWGGGYSDTRLNEDYAMREIEAGAKLGVEVVELDDGWQKGRSANSLLIKDRKKDGVWNGYWAFDPNFWDADPVRFSHGLAPLVAAAKAHGMDFGLWFGPDSSNDAANWEKDADRLLAYYRDPGIRYFKIDSMKSFSPLALAHQRAMFDKMLAESSSNIVFDLDVTAEIRPGYFGLPDIGTLFVENRYAKHCSWWPHQTLRNLWSLSEVIDPVRLRMEFLDPKQHADRYAERFPGSPLRPELWKGDAVFATVMLSSPLCWMEIQGLQPETVAEMSPLIATWKRERDRLHEGVTFPVGAKPDGFSWTGFVTSAADGKGGHVLLFRECAKEPAFELDLAPYVAADSVETLAGSGMERLDGTKLRVEIPETLGYLWLKVK